MLKNKQQYVDALCSYRFKSMGFILIQNVELPRDADFLVNVWVWFPTLLYTLLMAVDVAISHTNL